MGALCRMLLEAVLTTAAGILLLACTEVRDAGGQLAEWIACPTDLIDCGRVYQCAAESDTPSGHVEICIDYDDQPEQLDEIEALWGRCEPTPRHQGLCVMRCPPETGAGCNAFSGCYCP
jgi:hypothetical protein